MLKNGKLKTKLSFIKHVLILVISFSKYTTQKQDVRKLGNWEGYRVGICELSVFIAHFSVNLKLF